MKVCIAINAPELTEISNAKSYSGVLERIQVWINRINQQNGSLNFDELYFLDLSGKKVQSPERLYKLLSSQPADHTLYFYLGAVERFQSSYFLRQHQSKDGRISTFVDLNRLLKSGKEVFVFCDNFSKHSDLGDVASLKSENATIRDSFSGARTYFDDFVTLNRLVPNYRLTDLILFLTRDQGYHSGTIPQNPEPPDWITSFHKTFVLWREDPDNFSSDNKGSREDGIQTLRYLAGQIRYAEDARFLLEYFSSCDPDENVRSAALRALKTVRHARIRTPQGSGRLVPGLEKLLGPFNEVASGDFLMGSQVEEDSFSLPEEQPKHSVHINEFLIQRAPVSVLVYREFLYDIGKLEVLERREDGDDVTPMTNVSWYEAIEFCIWLNGVSHSQGWLPIDWEFRLPTEAEWEKAARGVHGRIYPWGNTFNKNACNYRDLAIGKAVASGNFSPMGDSPYGIWDMAGNTWDWTISLWGEGGAKPDFSYPYNPRDGREDILAGPHIRRVVRGGAYYYWDYCLRTSTRNLMFPDTKHSGGGFRLIKSRSGLLKRSGLH